jgi:hypothetical protein
MKEQHGPSAGLILTEDGFPAAAQATAFKCVTVHPPGQMPWVCLAIRSEAHGSPAAPGQPSPTHPPALSQFAMDPKSAHRLGLELIALAQAALRAE